MLAEAMNETLTCTLDTATALLQCGNHTYAELDEDVVGSSRFYVDLGVSIGLVAGGGLAAGLTMSLLTLDPMNLEVLEKSGTPSTRRHAANVTPLVHVRVPHSPLW